jgi:hypothetical protein
MTKLTGTALDRAVAHAMGLKSIHNCEQWGKEMANAYFEDHPTDPDKVILRKPRHEDDDDIQDYKKPWAGLTQEELCEIVGVSTSDSDWNVIKVQEWLRKVEAKLKEKNT